MCICTVIGTVHRREQKVHYDIAAEWKASGREGGVVVVELKEGDTATNYASTSRYLCGPSMLAIELRRSGVSTYEYDGTPMRTPSFVREAVRYGEIVWLD